MFTYKIEGGFPIKGKLRASGNKNAALPCIAAAVLTDQPVILRNVPDIEDVHVMFDIVRAVGGTVEPNGDAGEWKLQVNNIVRTDIPLDSAARVRASILFAGPMVARAGKVVLPPPGGDVIGRRRLDTHFIALSGLGARVQTDGVFTIQANKLVGENLFLDEASVTATENAIMAAALAEGTTVIENAASEPHVQDLCRLLNAMGARIEGVGSNILRIVGVKKLGGADYAIGADYMEVGSLIGLAAVTRGELKLRPPIRKTSR